MKINNLWLKIKPTFLHFANFSIFLWALITLIINAYWIDKLIPINNYGLIHGTFLTFIFFFGWIGILYYWIIYKKGEKE